MEIKNFIRKEKLALRNQMEPVIREQKSHAIMQRALSLPCIQNAGHVLCYAGYQSEVSTAEFIRELLAEEKRVYLPRVNGEAMEFYRISKEEDLVSGYKGILEPSLQCMQMYEAEEDKDTAMIMPGCAFARDGSRIGYGKGYYDRYLDKHTVKNRIAFCFSEQIAENIPTQQHDKKALFIVTEEEVIHCVK